MSRDRPKPTAPGANAGGLFAAGGEAAAILSRLDWHGRSIGPPESWPQSLRTALSICLASRHPICILWGSDYTYLYNDAYAPIVGSKHPGALGAPYPEVWPEIWEKDIKPVLEPVMSTGIASWADNLLLILQRYGYNEECYFSFSFAPIREESGKVGGVFTAITETTPQVVGQRRLKTLSELGARTTEAKTVEAAIDATLRVLSENPYDCPFTLVFLLDHDQAEAVLRGGVGIPADRPLGPARVPVGSDPWGFAQVLGSGQALHRTALPPAFAQLPGRPWPDFVAEALVLPVARSGQPGLYGFLVCGLSPRRRYDAEYRNFLVLVGNQLGTAIAAALAYEDERKRAESLAELDRAKTAFFSNVSHEFRTPLTLMLGMLRDALEDREGSLAAEHRARLEVAHRNSLRLLKLVNTLLDFARIEAGRVQASYEPTDLAAATADLASCFRSAMERAGLRLIVNCPPLPEPVYVDRDMWEKIVLNLLSNAFKFTLRGEVEVSLEPEAADVLLRVRDTGVGIAEENLHGIFERFQRVADMQGRSHEGSGIGLALVEELVKLHGGSIEVSSATGAGTTFRVRIPRGTAHLPAERIGSARPLGTTALRAESFLEEALGWLPDEPARVPQSEAQEGAAVLGAAEEPSGRVLVVDDNADMRDYLRRLLSSRYEVETVANVSQALEAVARARPDLLLSDVMMPGADGFELLRRLRQDTATRDLPIVLLSARAGEESRIEALAAGADDYLVKPFSARELMSRVEHHALKGRIRSAEQAHARRLSRIFQHAPVAIAVLRGPLHVFEFANPPYLELIGNRDVLGLPAREALPELANQGIFELLDGVFRTGEPYVGRSLRVDIALGPRGEPQERYFDFVYQPLPGDDGRTESIVVVVFEVTLLTRAQREAEAASRAKDEFLAMLGHELRNPLAPIVTALQLLRLRGVREAEREREIIERQIRHMSSLVDDLLDVSRLTGGKVSLRKEPALLADLVARAVEQASPLLEQQGHTLELDVAAEPLTVYVDTRRIAQVIANLLTNAAKYTEPGGRIVVTAGAQNGEAVVRVRDNGIGIPPELLPRIFDLFYQEGQPSERSRGGLGLGLAIARRFAELHGGSLTAASAGRGQGSVFTVRLPLAEHAPADAIQADPARGSPVEAGASGEGVRVLIVDDNIDAAHLLADSLRACGYTTLAAYDGPSALEAARTFLPDVALLDIGLPAMDGYELGQRLCELHSGSLRLYAVTGYGQVHDRQRAEAAGFAGHFIKPVDIDVLERALRGQRIDVSPGAD